MFSLEKRKSQDLIGAFKYLKGKHEMCKTMVPPCDKGQDTRHRVYVLEKQIQVKSGENLPNDRSRKTMEESIHRHYEIFFIGSFPKEPPSGMVQKKYIIHPYRWLDTLKVLSYGINLDRMRMAWKATHIR